MPVTMTNTQFTTGHLELVNRLGGPATVENPSWSADDPSIAVVEASEDGMGFKVSPATPGSTVGSTDVIFNGDADLTLEGVKPLELRGAVTFTAGEAASGTIEFAAPEEIP